MGQMDKYKDEERAKLAASLVAYGLEVTAEEILEGKRGTARAAQARQIAMYVVYVGFGISLARVAIAFNRDRSTVAYACHQIEDRRDDPDFDTWVDALESALRTAARLAGHVKAAA